MHEVMHGRDRLDRPQSAGRAGLSGDGGRLASGLAPDWLQSGLGSWREGLWAIGWWVPPLIGIGGLVGGGAGRG